MDKKEKIKVSAFNLLDNTLPDVTILLSDKNGEYCFKGVYDGNRTLPAKLLKLMENDEIKTKGADK